MSGMIILIPAALVLGLAGLGAFLWSLRSGQFDDLDGAAVRILEDDEDRHKVDKNRAATASRRLGGDRPS
jgi:cbb3-type cytochrome oxidase maturation protein